MTVGRHKQKEKINLNINGAEIKCQNSVTLLGVEIDNELNFNNHISNICKKAGNKINAISRIQNSEFSNFLDLRLDRFLSTALIYYFSTFFLLYLFLVQE